MPAAVGAPRVLRCLALVGVLAIGVIVVIALVVELPRLLSRLVLEGVLAIGGIIVVMLVVEPLCNNACHNICHQHHYCP